jgi:electron transport complex protein RnfG
VTLPGPLRASLVLAAFAVVGSGLLAATFELTRGPIAAAERAALERSLHSLVSPDQHDNDLLNDTVELDPSPLLGTRAPTLAYRARKGGAITAVAFTAVAPDGYNGDIQLLVAVRVDGTLIGVRAVKEKETPGLGDAIEIDRSPWIRIFEGRSLDNPKPAGWKVRKDGGEFDQLTGATITPRAVVKAVRKSLEFFAENKAALLAENRRSEP